MSYFRKGNTDFLCETPVTVTDYLRDNTKLPKSDTISYKTVNTSIVIRPSGTEPKLKIYLAASYNTEKESEEEIIRLKYTLTEIIRIAENLPD